MEFLENLGGDARLVYEGKSSLSVVRGWEMAGTAEVLAEADAANAAANAACKARLIERLRKQAAQ